MRLAELRRRILWRAFPDSPEDGSALWGTWCDAHDGDPEAALGELLAVLLEADLL